MTRSAYRAITTEALITECHALEASYAAVKAQEPESDNDQVAEYESVLNTVTEVLARRVEDGDPVAVDWYSSYDDDAADAPSGLWADEAAQPDAAAQSPEDALENWHATATLLSWLKASYCTGRRNLPLVAHRSAGSKSISVAAGMRLSPASCQILAASSSDQ